MKTIDVGVTYTGTESPFVDRIYRSRLTFEPGQTRALPVELATKFLLHADVFQRADEHTTTSAPPIDDTSDQLQASKKSEQDHREKENARFELVQHIEQMDKPALMDWAKVNFQQELPRNLGVEKLRERVVGLIDQFGAP